jgi:simple sugar transport system substrate-binding protein
MGMKKILVSAVLVFAFFASLTALPRVAVLDITAQADIDSSVVAPVTETIMEEVVGARAYIVLDRAYVEQVLKEMQFELSGLVTDTQAAKAGQFLGADYVVAGKVQTIGDTYFIVAKMIEVRTGVIVAQASEQGEGKLSTLLGMSRLVGRKLVSGAPVAALEPAARQGTDPATAPAAMNARRIRAGFVIPTPMRDDNFAAVAAINRVKARHAAWLDVFVAENVHPENCAAAIDRLVEADVCDIVICCSGEVVEEVKRAADRYPKVLFECEGIPWDEAGAPNLGVFGFNESRHFYLQGLVAGSLSSSGKIAVLAESPAEQPWWYQLIDRFALGVKAANPKARIFVDFRPPDHWDKPEGDVDAAKSLVSQGCDFVWGCSSPQLVWSLEKAGPKVRSFLNDFTYKLAPAVVVSGPLRDWSVLFDTFLLALKEGTWKREALYPVEASIFGGGAEAFNPAFLAELQAKKLKTPDRGAIPLLELLDLRAEQMASGQFEPFTGPIKDQKGVMRLPAGVRADWKFLESIDWLMDNVKVAASSK